MSSKLKCRMENSNDKRRKEGRKRIFKKREAVYYLYMDLFLVVDSSFEILLSVID